jgi:hypothetical protein
MDVARRGKVGSAIFRKQKALIGNFGFEQITFLTLLLTFKNTLLKKLLKKVE